MAGPIFCDAEDGNLAALMVTDIDGAETYAVCVSCLPGWFAAIATRFGLSFDETTPEPGPETEPGNGDEETDEDTDKDSPAVVEAATPSADGPPSSDNSVTAHNGRGTKSGRKAEGAEPAPEADASAAVNG